MKKRGISLAIETIVIATLALFILVLMIYFVRKTFVASYDWLDYIDDQLKTQVLEQCKTGNQKVLLHKNSYDKSEMTFAAIKNIGNDNEFTINILEVSGKGARIIDWFDYRKDSIQINRGECALVGINMHIPSDTVSGSYIFDLKVSNNKGLYAAAEFLITVKSDD